MINSALVASDVSLPNEIEMSGVGTENFVYIGGLDPIPGLNHLLSLQAFARGIINVRYSPCSTSVNSSNSHPSPLRHYQYPPSFRKYRKETWIVEERLPGPRPANLFASCDLLRVLVFDDILSETERMWL